MESTMMGSIRGCICLRRMIVTEVLFLFIPSKLLGLFGTLQCCCFFLNRENNLTYLF